MNVLKGTMTAFASNDDSSIYSGNFNKHNSNSKELFFNFIYSINSTPEYELQKSACYN